MVDDTLIFALLGTFLTAAIINLFLGLYMLYAMYRIKRATEKFLEKLRSSIEGKDDELG